MTCLCIFLSVVTLLQTAVTELDESVPVCQSSTYQLQNLLQVRSTQNQIRKHVRSNLAKGDVDFDDQLDTNHILDQVNTTKGPEESSDPTKESNQVAPVV